MSRLKISDSRRFLIHDDGRPFFYLADTAWELFHRLDRAQTLRYLKDRTAKRFTVIQAVALAELDGMNIPNAMGHRPFEGNDLSRPVEAYWQHVDWVVDQAEAMGLFIGLLPTWGDKWFIRHGAGPELFTPDNAFQYGRWIGRRYAGRQVIWILGGDRKVETPRHREINEHMARGVREGDGGSLMTFHPQGGESSSPYFHQSDWLDFNTHQTGHGRNSENYKRIEADYARQDPVKPTLDAEPGYEDHPAGFNIDNGYLDDYDCRKAIYWATLAGACGHTYGCHPIWQFWQPGRTPLSVCRTSWEDALHLPGSGQMQWCRALLESRPYLTRMPDQSLIASENRGGSRHVRAARDGSGSYAMIYCPLYEPVRIDVASLTGKSLVGHWFDPRDGTSTRIGIFDRAASPLTFQPPHGGPDWVLVLDDADRGYGRPGQSEGAGA